MLRELGARVGRKTLGQNRFRLTVPLFSSRIFSAPWPRRPEEPGKTERRSSIRRNRVVLLILATLWIVAQSGAASSQDRAPSSGDAEALLVEAPRTDSPRATIESFKRLHEALTRAVAVYSEERSFRAAERVILIADEWRTLIDLSGVPETSQLEIGGETGAYLIDIFNRIGWPDAAMLPDQSTIPAAGPAIHALPQTPFRLVRVEEGPHAGEFLFESRTVKLAPRFLRSIQHLPPRFGDGIESWAERARQLTGPLVPAGLVRAVPELLNATFLGTPLWKVMIVAVLILIAVAALLLVHRRISSLRQGTEVWRLALCSLSPIAIAATASFLHFLFATQVNVSGSFSRGLDIARTVIIHLTLAWAFWSLIRAAFECVVSRSSSAEQSFDNNMLRLLARIAGLMVGIVILAYGAQRLGLPVFSILAGLGIGGLAIALAVRPTVENLIGGFVLYLDRPIRVGDFCSFDEQSGTVESIGVRSTQIRALDRTLVSIPNAQFADMQIVNWAQCDNMLINQRIGLRYETKTDQLRFVLVKIREMLHAHPRIESETVRVRFADYGDSSLDLDIRVYAKTREWNDFFAIKEDVLFRVKEIVEAAGAAFAFPSRTLYLGRDDAPNEELVREASASVEAWRRTGTLPFPRFDDAVLSRINNTLDYPPRGSRESYCEVPAAEGAELLSSGRTEESSAPANVTENDGEKPR